MLFFVDGVFIFPHGFVDKNVVVPNFNFINQSNLDKILKVEVFVHSGGQLRAVHLILGYTPISKSFQAPKCVIKAKDSLRYHISVAISSFLTTDPIPKGIPKVALSFQHVVEEEATPS